MHPLMILASMCWLLCFSLSLVVAASDPAGGLLLVTGLLVIAVVAYLTEPNHA